MQNNIKVWIESSTLSFDLNSHDEGVYLISDLDGLTSLPSIRTSAGVNAGTDGGWTSAQAFDARLISLSVVIANEDVSIVESKRRLLNSLLAQSRKETLKLHFTTEAGMEFIINVRITAVTGALTNILKKQELLIQMRADDPIIYGAQGGEGADATLLVQQTQSGFEIPFEIPLLIGGGSDKVDVEDLGTEEVYPIIKMTGPLHNPTVVNETQNAEIGINADLGDMEWRGYQSAELYGNATQQTYTGKNLLNITNSDLRATSAGLTLSFNSDGSIHYNGTPSQTYAFFTTEVNLALPAGTYTFGIGSINSSANVYLRFKMADTTEEIVQIDKGVSSSITYTFTQATVSYILAFRGMTVNTAISGDIKQQLEAGSMATSYEKYVGGIPAPNPDYPQDVNTVTGAQTVKITGKNILPTITGSAAQASVTLTSTDGNITASGTATANITFTLTGTDGITYRQAYWQTITASATNSVELQKGTYYLGATATLGNISAQFRLVDLGQKLEDGTSISLNSSFTITEPKRLCITIYVNNGNAPNVNISDLQLELGTQGSDYEPYQGQSQEINLGKNLFSPEQAVIDSNNAETFITPDGKWLQFQTGSNRLVYNFPQKAGTTFTITTIAKSIEAGNNGFNLQIMYADGTTETLFSQQLGDGAEHTNTATKTLAKDMLYFRTAYTDTKNAQLKIDGTQLEMGSQATSYAPYKTPLELAKIGTYRDYIWNDDGTWKIHKEVGKVVFDGSEAWSVYGFATELRYAFYQNITDKYFSSGTATSIFCDTYTPSTSGGTSASEQNQFTTRGTTYNTVVYLFTPHSAIAGTTENEVIANFKTFLASHNTTIYYILATPTDTEITDAELVGQLDALLNYAPWYGDDQNVFLIPSAGADGTLILGAHNEPKPADEVLIDTHLKTVTLNGQNAYPLLKDGSSFFSLAPGDNIMYLTSDVSSDTGKAEIKFKQGFISI